MGSLRRKLQNREVSIGTWIQIGHPAVAEILGELDFDWIAADCEHTDITIREFGSIARGLHGRGPVPLVRVGENDTLAIRQALDLGAQGVIVPLVNSALEAERAVAAAKFPPAGVRGFAYTRSNEYGATFDAYAAHANDEICVIAMIETRAAVSVIDEILAVDGIDGVFIGPYDLSGSYGVPGQVRHEEVVAAQCRVVEACERAGKSAGLHVVTPGRGAVHAALDAGFTFIAMGMDTVFLRSAAVEGLEHIGPGSRADLAGLAAATARSASGSP